MGRHKHIKKQMDTKHKPRLNRQKTFWVWGLWPKGGGLLTAYGTSSGGRLTGVTKTGGLLTGERLTGGGRLACRRTDHVWTRKHVLIIITKVNSSRSKYQQCIQVIECTSVSVTITGAKNVKHCSTTWQSTHRLLDTHISWTEIVN